MQLSKELTNEINEYKNFITDHLNINIPKNLIQKENTFNTITINGIKKFINYLIKEKQININNINSLLDYMVSYILDYAYFLIKNLKTEGIIIKLRFVKSLFTFYISHYNINSEKKNKIDNILNDLSKLKSRIKFEDGIRGKNKEVRKQISINKIISAIDLLNMKYKINKNYNLLKAKVALKCLIHLCWRSSNIINLKIGETLNYKDNLWHYYIPPNQQKVPEKEGNKYKAIQGIIPDILQDDFNELIRISGAHEYLFRKNDNSKYNPSSFGNYIKKITKKYIGEELNPHVFRDIVSTYLINHDVNPIYVSTFLWHKPANLTSIDLKYVKIDRNKAVSECNKQLMSLYKKISERQKSKNKNTNNIIYFKKDET